MIIQPDFLDHWKTQLLCDLLEDPCAPIYLIRLWSHCQNRKASKFDGLTANAVKAICRAPCDAAKFLGALEQSDWVKLENGSIEVLGFEEVNQQLFASWHNGKKGGRKPKGNPRVTGGEPLGGAIREEKRREEPSPPSPRGVVEEAELISRGVRYPKQSLAQARANGSSELHIRAVLEHFDAHPGAWDGGALYERVRTLHPKQDPATLWPPESDEYRRALEQTRRAQVLEKQATKRQASKAELDQQRARELDLEREWGPIVDNLKREEAESMLRSELGDMAPGILRKWARGSPPEGLARDTLILILEREESRVEA